MLGRRTVPDTFSGNAFMLLAAFAVSIAKAITMPDPMRAKGCQLTALGAS